MQAVAARPVDRRGAGPPDLPRRVARLRRSARRRRLPAEPLSRGVPQPPCSVRVWKWRGGVVDEAAPPAGSLDRRRLAGGASPGRGGRAARRERRAARALGSRLPGTPRRPAPCAWPAIRSSSRRGDYLGGFGLDVPDRARRDRSAGRHRPSARAVPSRRLDQELRRRRRSPASRAASA